MGCIAATRRWGMMNIETEKGKPDVCAGVPQKKKKKMRTSAAIGEYGLFSFVSQASQSSTHRE